MTARETGGTADAAIGQNASAFSTYFVTSLSFGNPNACLPQSLPADATGMAKCQVFYLLAAGDSCAAHPGLTAASADVAASILRVAGITVPVCTLAQVPMTDWVNGSCASASLPGWCYLTGTAAGACPQKAVLSAAAGALPTNASVALGCGGPSLSGVAPTVATSTPTALVGTTCIPSPEQSATFVGFNYRDVTLDADNGGCGGGVCLVDHFQGLTTCPYGQDKNGSPIPPATSACTVPGTDTLVLPDNPTAGQTIEPQCTDRRPRQTVSCSCRCGNAEGATDDGAHYCNCLSGYTCSQVVPAVFPGDPFAGGYCVPSGASFSPLSACPSVCAAASPCP
jgi:hypothetical protein